MAEEIRDVYPGSENPTHEIVLARGGRKFGLTLANGVQSIHVVPPPRQQPPISIQQNSWEKGRGAEVWLPNANNYADGLNVWSTTPNKLHPTMLQRWATGMRDAEQNMPYANGVHTWVSLTGATRFLDVAFTASATSNRERWFFILRRKNGSTPGTLTAELCIDSAGSPSTVQKTVTKAATDAPDSISYYIEFKPSSVLAVTASTVYHLKIYGAAGDLDTKCWEILCDTAAAGLSSAAGSSWTATTYSPYYRITDEDIAQRLFVFPFDSAYYAVTRRLDGTTASKLYINGCRGKATAGAATTLTDSGAGQYGGTWVVNGWAGYKVRIIRGTGQGQVRTIASNTATVLTVSTAWYQNPDTTSEYYIYGGPAWKEITGHGLTICTAKPSTSNGICYFPQGDGTDMRRMHLDYTQANDHAFAAEGTAHNQAYFLCNGYSATDGPQLWRANEENTAAGTPGGKAISVARANMSPSGTPIGWGTDLTFKTSILTGDNTYRITGIHIFQNNLYVPKEDTMYVVSNDVPSELKYGANASPSLYNGVAACTGMDGQFYIAANHDVMLIAGSASYPSNLPNQLPSARSGYVTDMLSILGWLFGALDAGDGDSSVMKLSLDTKTWSEQLRSWITGRRIRNICWQTNPETRPILWVECGGELIYQEFPMTGMGIRPVDDTGSQYQHEGIITFPTIDLLTTDPKYFSFLTLSTKGLASNTTTSAAYGREVIFEYQLDDQIGGSTWTLGGSFGISPQDKVQLNKGSRHKLRPRFRINSNKAADPPIVENFGLSLFTRTKTYNAFLVDVDAASDEDFKASDLYNFLLEMTLAAEVVNTQSIISFLHNKQVIIEVQPNISLTGVDETNGFDAVMQVYMELLPQ